MQFTKWAVLGVFLIGGLPAAGATEAPTPQNAGRYMPLYPGLYVNATLAHDAGDEAFGRNGGERSTALPNTPGHSRLPETRFAAAFQWYFPLFEAYDWPFVSERLFTARATLRGMKADTEGDLAGFNNANGFENSADGYGDLTLEYGVFLAGSSDWREDLSQPFSSVLLLGIDIPTGGYDADASANGGDNEFAYFATLGGNLRAGGWLLDAGFTYKDFGRNEEPAYGNLYPAQRGDLLSVDLSLARPLGDFLVNAFVQYQDGDANSYENPEFTTNARPEPPPLMENRPAPGRFADDGTELLTAGLSVNYFWTQNLVFGLHAIEPLDGKSGSFMFPFNNQLAGCEMTTPPLCMPTANGAVRQDGFGSARAFANTVFMLSLGYSFPRGDPWL